MRMKFECLRLAISNSRIRVLQKVAALLKFMCKQLPVLYLEFFRKVLYSCTVQKVAALLKFMCKQLPVCCIFFEKFLIVSVIFF
jgi:hypothetical protein